MGPVKGGLPLAFLTRYIRFIPAIFSLAFIEYGNPCVFLKVICRRNYL